MEAYRSGHNGPDSKSGSPHGLVGSNPTASARQGSPCSESAVILYKGESLHPYLGSFVRLDPFVRTPRSESRPGRTDGAGSFPGNRGTQYKKA